MNREKKEENLYTWLICLSDENEVEAMERCVEWVYYNEMLERGRREGKCDDFAEGKKVVGICPQ